MRRVREPGRSVSWMRMDGEVVSGVPTSPFVKACLFADFGNGVDSATHAHEWSYANLDIFADEDGVYAKGTRTVFVGPGCPLD